MIYGCEKLFLFNKIINITRTTKNQENSAHRFGKNCLPKNLVKFLQYRIKAWKVGALRLRTETVAHRCSLKKVFLEISQNSQENTCGRVSLLIKLGLGPATLLKKILWHRCFHVNFAKFLRTPLFTEHLWWLLLTG